MKHIYLDYAATTPMDPEVEKAMRPYFSKKFGNAGSLHFFGQEAMSAVDDAREKIASSIGAQFREVIFTGSATEANNLALRGVLNSNKRQETRDKHRIIVSVIEHESVLETARDLERDGIEVIVIPVSREGVVDLEKLKAALNERTILVSVMYVNNEIGSIQPIFEISEMIKERKLFSKKSVSEAERARFSVKPKERGREPSGRTSGWASETPSFREESFRDIYPLFHIDAAQAFQYFDCDVNKLGVDLMTLSAHKIYGPKGIGALYVNNELRIKNHENKNPAIHNSSFIIHPLVTGGGQEFGLRSGTENVPSIVGFAKAIELAAKERELNVKKIMNLRNYFWKELKKIAPRAELNGGGSPHILNVYFPNIKSQDFLTRLDLEGIAASSGAACSARSLEPSYVITALGYSRERAEKSIRFSFGKFLSQKDIDFALMILKRILEKKM